jgi:hypothetical protein
MGDKGRIAGCAGPRRQIAGFAASKMRPVTGNIAGKRTATSEAQSQTERENYRAEPLDDHVARRVPDRCTQFTQDEGLVCQPGSQMDSRRGDSVVLGFPDKASTAWTSTIG